MRLVATDEPLAEGFAHELPVPVRLTVLGTLSLSVGDKQVLLGESSARLLALLAVLNRGPVGRETVARRLWPDVSRDRGCANLRSVLWRLRNSGVPLITGSGAGLQIAPQATVDLWQVSAAAHTLLDQSVVPMPLELSQALRLNLYDDLLPDWDDDWLIHERHQHRQLRLHCLEALSAKLTSTNWHGAAVQTALAVVGADPLRESGHETLIRAHLAAGNRVDALRAYHEFRDLMRDNLGVEPTPRTRSLVEPEAGH